MKVMYEYLGRNELTTRVLNNLKKSTTITLEDYHFLASLKKSQFTNKLAKKYNAENKQELKHLYNNIHTVYNYRNTKDIKKLKMHLDFFNIDVTSTKIVDSFDMHYQSHCSKYGDYNPCYQYFIDKHYYDVNNKIVATLNLHIEILGYHSKYANYKNSELTVKTTTNYKDAEILTYTTKFNNKIFNVEKVIKIGNIDSYHYKNDLTDFKAYKKLVEKREKRLIEAREKRNLNKKPAAKEFTITTEELINKFGWCNFGITDFKRALNITVDYITNLELKKLWKHLEKETRDQLKKEYPQEISKLNKIMKFGY
jgi:hypothetical protein